MKRGRKTDPEALRRGAVISLRAPKSVTAKLDRLAKDKGVNRSAMLRLLIDEKNDPGSSSGSKKRLVRSDGGRSAAPSSRKEMKAKLEAMAPKLEKNVA